MRIGVDLGGTKIEAVLLASDGLELMRVRVPTPQGDYEATVRAVQTLVAQLESDLGTRKATVGVGIPGTLSAATGLVINANSTCLIGHPLDQDLQAALNRPVRLTNDANCFVASEAHDGAGQGFQVVFGVILGTGVGGGIFINGHVVPGHNGSAGEWGHNPLPTPQIMDGQDECPGPLCYCGRHGCIETFLSGPGLSADHLAHSGQTQSSEHIVIQAQSGDRAADASLRRYEHRLARALAGIINVLDPDVIVLGGGLSKIERLYETVPKLWGEWVFTPSVTTKLLRNAHGDSSGVRGAAWLWD